MRINKSRSKILVVIIMVLLALLGISGCNSEPDGTPMSLIRSDLEKCHDYSTMMVETESVEVIKRQTNIENKEDLVYVSIKGKNEYYEIVRNYKLRYVLYNEGWILENLTEYSDAEHLNITTPIKEAIKEEDIRMFLDSIDFSDISIESYFTFSPIVNNKVTYLNTEKQSAVLGENYGRIVYQCVVSYEYDTITEFVTLPIICDFSIIDGSWIMDIDNGNITRNAVLNKSIHGSWYYEDYMSYSKSNMRVDITYESDSTCLVSYFCSDGENGLGRMKLIRNHEYKNDGWYEPPTSPYELVWDDGNQHKGCRVLWVFDDELRVPVGGGHGRLDKQ